MRLNKLFLNRFTGVFATFYDIWLGKWFAPTNSTDDIKTSLSAGLHRKGSLRRSVESCVAWRVSHNVVKFLHMNSNSTKI